jgi:hypothetical protein
MGSTQLVAVERCPDPESFTSSQELVGWRGSSCMQQNLGTPGAGEHRCAPAKFTFKRGGKSGYTHHIVRGVSISNPSPVELFVRVNCPYSPSCLDLCINLPPRVIMNGPSKHLGANAGCSCHTEHCDIFQLLIWLSLTFGR